MQFGTTLRNNMIGQYETTVGTTAKLLLFTGAAPANCQATTSGTLLATLTLPSDWMTAASGGTSSKNGTWNGTAGAAGTAGHYRLYDNGTTVCHEQGSISTSGQDLNLDNTNIASGQVITITQWDRNIGLA